MPKVNNATPKKTVKPSRVSKKGRGQKGVEVDPSVPIEVSWQLHELPSSQHKVGLAGLALCVESLHRSGGLRGVCELAKVEADSLTLRVDRDGMQSLFDDIYAATVEEQTRAAPIKNRRDNTVIEPKCTIKKTETDKKGKDKTKTYYVYEQTVPRASLIQEWDAASSGQEQLWLKLWRDLVWTTLRAKPATRGAYDARAEKRKSHDGEEAWDALVRSPNDAVPLPSTYYLGAQGANAENVAFQDVARFQVLLHFWPYAVPIYVPAGISREGERELSGYAIAVADIQDLEGYVQDWPVFARNRSARPSGYLPADAVIDVASESALDLFVRFSSLLSKRIGASVVKSSIAAVDVFHIETKENNVRMRFTGRIDPKYERIDEYARIKSECRSPLFRRQRILNLLDDHEWWSQFGRLCATVPEVLTVGNAQFQHDCALAFKEMKMGENDVATGELESYVYAAVQGYVFGKLKQKYALEWAEVKGKPALERDYGEKKEKLARGAFLAVRSRTGADFVDYFTGTICSTAPHVGERGYRALARALFDSQQVEKVRSLTLLALAANA